MALSPTLILIAGVAGLVALALLIWGLLGRRVGQEPRCARCRFDLTGLNRPLETCPECGTSLAGARAIRTGLRRRGRIRIALALPLLLLASAAAGTGIWARASNFNLNTIKPIPWLVADARVLGPTAQPALDELLRRANAGTISKRGYAPIIRTGLKHQGDLTQTWEPKWGDLLMMAFTSGAMTPHQEIRFLHQILIAQSTTRPRVRQGDWIRMRTDEDIRAGSSPSLQLGYRVMPMAATSEGARAEMGWSTATTGELDQFVASAMTHRSGIDACHVVAPSDDDNWSLGLEPGTHVITMAIGYSVALTPQNGSDPRYPTPALPPDWTDAGLSALEFTDPKCPHAVSWIERKTFTIEIVPPDSPDVALDTKPDLVAQLRSALHVHRVFRSTSDQGWMQVGLTISRTGPTRLAVAAEVFARAPDGREWFLGRVAIPAEPNPSGNHAWGVSNGTSSTPGGRAPEDNKVGVEPLESFDANTVTIILRPAPAAARTTVDLDTICGSRLTFEDVPVTDR